MDNNRTGHPRSAMDLQYISNDTTMEKEKGETKHDETKRLQKEQNDSKQLTKEEVAELKKIRQDKTRDDKIIQK